MSRPTDTPLLKRSLDRRLWNKDATAKTNMGQSAIVKQAVDSSPR
jgi:hypothetical protein